MNDSDFDDLIGEDPTAEAEESMSDEAQEAYAVGATPAYPNLTVKEMTFCRLMVRGYTAEEAAKLAGYHKRHPREEIGRILFENNRIREGMKWIQAEFLRENNITVERVALEYARIAFFDPRELVDKNGKFKPLKKLSKAAAAAIKGVDVKETDFNGVSQTVNTKYVLQDKLKALESIARFMGMMPDNKVQVTGAGGGPLIINDQSNPMDTARRVAFLLLQAQRAQGQTYEAETVNTDGT